MAINNISGQECFTLSDSSILSGYGDVLDPDDVRRILGIGRNAVYKYLSNGEIPSIRIGKKYRIPKLLLIEYLYPEGSSRHSKVMN